MLFLVKKNLPLLEAQFNCVFTSSKKIFMSK